MDKRTRMKAGAGIAALAVVLAGGGYFYFHSDDGTPEHAIKTIERSIDKHDTKTFYRMVDVDSVLDSGYDGFVEGLAASAGTMTPDTQATVKDFAQLLRGSLILSLKSAIDSYISTGDLNTEKNLGVVKLLDRTGLNDASIRDVKNVQINDAKRDEAFADLIIFQPELDKEFPLHLVLTRGEDNEWKVSRVQNFQEYVADIIEARQAKLNDYLAKAAEINSKHDSTVREAEQKYGSILASGNLAKKETRDELKTLIDDVFKKDWAQRKQELFSLPVPKEAESLHNLYMRICDMSTDACEDYSKWMDDNNPATIKSAEEKIHQVQTLTTEAADHVKRITN